MPINLKKHRYRKRVKMKRGTQKKKVRLSHMGPLDFFLGQQEDQERGGAR